MISISRLLVAAAFALGATITLSNVGMATPIVDVTTSLASPQPLGTPVTITASATDTDPGLISYRFAIGPVGTAAAPLVRDFSVNNSFVFAPNLHEGAYKFVVYARNNSTGVIATTRIASFTYTSLVKGNAPSIHATANALVALFSSPPCAAGGVTMRAEFTEAGSNLPFYTPTQTCQAGQNLNFLIAGMRPKTQYFVNSQTISASGTTVGPKVLFTTGTPPILFPTFTIPRPLLSTDDQTQRFILLSPLMTADFVFGVDLSATPIWYYGDPNGTPLLTRPLPGGDMLVLALGNNSAGTGYTVGDLQILRKIDLAGNVIHETNATRVAEQVSKASGIASECHLGGTECLVGEFSHDAIELPNGHTLAITSEEQVFTDGTQGSSPSNPVDIFGDIIVDLDQNLQLAWYWRAFDHMNVNRAAILNETCAPAQPGCPPITLVTTHANDWLHGNAIQYEPADGSIIYSTRHQDWILKIDYGNGTGTHDTIWTLGLDGDFAMNSTDPYPWFSHQHDPGFVQTNSTTIGTTQIAMFDNGNTRVSPPPLGLGSGDSRGYVLNIDQTAKTVTPVLLADLGFFSMALGTAELLQDGHWEFEAGSDAPNSQSIEVYPDATLSFTLQLNGSTTYRCFRMQTLYQPIPKS